MSNRNDLGKRRERLFISREREREPIPHFIAIRNRKGDDDNNDNDDDDNDTMPTTTMTMTTSPTRSFSRIIVYKHIAKGEGKMTDFALYNGNTKQSERHGNKN